MATLLRVYRKKYRGEVRIIHYKRMNLNCFDVGFKSGITPAEQVQNTEQEIRYSSGKWNTPGLCFASSKDIQWRREERHDYQQA